MLSKSFLVFSALNHQEKVDFKNYINSQNNTKKKLFLKLLNIYERHSHTNLIKDHKEMSASLFPDDSKGCSRLRLLQSDFLKELESFIVTKAALGSVYNNRKLILDFLKERGLVEVANKNLVLYKKEIEKANSIGLGWVRDALLIAEFEYQEAIRQRNEAKFETESLISLIDKEFILKKLSTSCLVASQEHVYNLTFDHGLLASVISFIEVHELMEDPAIGCYYFCYRMLSDERSDHHFELFMEKLRKYSHLLSSEDNTQLHTLAINYCIRALNLGAKGYGLKGLELYQSAFENGLMLVNNKISKFTFRNIITMAVRVEEFELAEQFIKKYMGLLEAEDRENMVHFTTALILFSREKYDQAGNELVKVSFKDLLFNLATRGLQIKIYYEMGEIMVLRSHLDALQIFLKRHKSLGYHKANYLNIITYVRKLMGGNSKEKLLALRDKVVQEKFVTEKKWLLEKIQEKLDSGIQKIFQ